MELRVYFKIAARWWWLILLPPLVVGVYSLARRQPAPAAYATSLRFTAGQPAAPAASGYDPNYYRWLTSEYIVGGLKDWVRTSAFADAVSAELTARGLSIPSGGVAGAITYSDNARSILVIGLQWNDAAQLTTLAQAVTTVLQTKNAAAFPQLGGQTATVTLLDQGGLAPVTPSLRARFDVPLKVGLALVAGLALALAAHYFDPFVREKGELENLGMPVVAEIPKGGKRQVP